MLFFFAQKNDQHRTPNEAFAQAFLERLAGSQGRALRRAPQSAEPPFDFPDLPRGKINQNKKNNRVPQDAKSFAHKVRSWERPSFRTVFPYF